MIQRLKITRIVNRNYNWVDTGFGQLFGGMVRLCTFGHFSLNWSRTAILKRLNGKVLDIEDQ